jgi:hypothetical protein
MHTWPERRNRRLRARKKGVKAERGQSLLLTVDIVLCEGGVMPRHYGSNMLGRATT